MSVTYTYAHALARARTHTQTKTHAQMPHLRSSSAPFPSVAARPKRGRPGTRASATLLALALAPARQRSQRLTRCACWRYYSSLPMLPTGGAWQRRSARPGRWQPPCGRRCREWLRGSTAPSATRIRSWGAFPRPSSTTRSAWRVQRRWATGRGRAGHTRTWATRISRRGTSARPSSTTRRTWRLQRRRAGEGTAYGNLGNA